MKYFKKEKYMECSKYPPLTRIVQNSTNGKNVAYLVVTEELKKFYIWKNTDLDCCYQEIFRKGTNKMADNLFGYF